MKQEMQQIDMTPYVVAMMTPYVVAMRKYITELDMACEVELRARLDHLMRQWSFELSAYMVSVKHKEEVKEKTRSIKVTLSEYVEVPSSWWQHFKFEWFPNWLTEIWPVDLMKMHVQHSEDIAVHVVENHITKVCPHLSLKNGPHHLAWMAGDSRYDEVEEAKEVWRLRSFLRRLVNDTPYDPSSCLYYDCSPRVIEEAKKALDGK